MAWTGRTAAAVVACAVAVVTAGTASASWAPAGSASIHPGVVVKIAGEKCVAGYVVRARHRVFLAVPASCGSGSPGEAQTDCVDLPGIAPPGLPVTVQGARYDAVVAYSSWFQMEVTGVSSNRKCANNDLQLLRLDRRDRKRVNPSIPLIGGPDGVSQAATAAPATLSLLLDGVASTAQAVATSAGGWDHTMIVNGAVPVTAIGSPVLTSGGKALGMVSVVPPQGMQAGQTEAHDLYRELRALRRVKGFHRAHLVRGTVGFKG